VSVDGVVAALALTTVVHLAEVSMAALPWALLVPRHGPGIPERTDVAVVLAEVPAAADLAC